MSYILDALTKAARQRDRQVPVVQRLLSPAPRPRAPWSNTSGRLLIALGMNAVLLAAVLFWSLGALNSQAGRRARQRAALEDMLTQDWDYKGPTDTPS